MTALHAARVAARIRRELGIEVDRIHGRYGEFQVLLDGETIVDAGPLALLGVLPGAKKIVESVRARLSSRPLEKSP